MWRLAVMSAEAFYILWCIPGMKRKQKTIFARWKFVKWAQAGALLWLVLAVVQLFGSPLVVAGMAAVGAAFFMQAVRPSTQYGRYGLWFVALACGALSHALEYGWWLRGGEAGLLHPALFLAGVGVLLVRGHARAGTPMGQIIAEGSHQPVTPDAK